MSLERDFVKQHADTIICEPSGRTYTELRRETNLTGLLMDVLNKTVEKE